MIVEYKERKLSNMHILKFLHELLEDESKKYRNLIEWEDRNAGVFKILLPNELALLWGHHKNSNCMTYDKMSRALRYYYRDKILSKCGRLCYKFHWENPLFGLSVKNIKIKAEDRIEMGHFLSTQLKKETTIVIEDHFMHSD